MACFLVPMAQAAATTMLCHAVKSSKWTNKTLCVCAQKLHLLNKMLWGGSALLAFEHILNGELTWSFPFFTALQNGGVHTMLHEMATEGTAISIFITAVWAFIVLTSAMHKKMHTSKYKMSARAV